MCSKYDYLVCKTCARKIWAGQACEYLVDWLRDHVTTGMDEHELVFVDRNIDLLYEEGMMEDV